MSKGSKSPVMPTPVAEEDKALDKPGGAIADFAGRLDQQAPISANETFIHFLVRSLREMSNIKFALASFVVNNLRRRYRRSVLGFAWSSSILLPRS